MRPVNSFKVLIGILGFVLGMFLTTCSTTAPSAGAVETPAVSAEPDQPTLAVPREFRAAWVATVANIDWPSKPGLSTAEQQAEALHLLDSAVALNLNAIIFQVRPQCDALYNSELEPWSYYLTGEQGTAPEPYYDPLTFWVTEAHQRGLELHAWFNPYRAHHPNGQHNETSVIATHPELVREIDNGYFWLDPSLPAVRDYSLAVVMDVVQRYDIDGVHFDDYFYPYSSIDFPDSVAWEKYRAGGGVLSRHDWRREAVNTFIQQVYTAIKAEKPWVKFGISPFGIWRPGYPASIKGYDQYDKLYADARLWLQEGWVDYWTPQLYWPTRKIPQSYPVLLGWWTRQNFCHRHIWPGLFTSKIKTEADALENFSQVMITRGMVPDDPGNVHFSMKALQKNYSGIADILLSGPYASPALIPPSPWLDDQAPAAPLVELEHRDGQVHIHWLHEDRSDVAHWIIYLRRGKTWEYQILTADQESRVVPHVIRAEDGMTPPRVLDQVAVTAVDRLGNESAWHPLAVR